MADIQNPGCLSFLLRLFGVSTRSVEGSDAAATFPYRVRDDFLSAAELSFYHVLTTVLDGRGIICIKVGLADIFFVTRPHENLSARNRIAQKHVDFLVCDLRTLKPLFGLELDDASHARSDRKTRDEFVDRTFQVAQLPLLHVAAQHSYNLQDLAAQVMPFFDQGISAAVPDLEKTAQYPLTTEGGVASPDCPKCGMPMVLRTAAKGGRAGQQFYGCANYPKCRETQQI